MDSKDYLRGRSIKHSKLVAVFLLFAVLAYALFENVLRNTQN